MVGRGSGLAQSRHDPGELSEAHVEDDGVARIGEKAPVAVRIALALMAGHKSDTVGESPMSERQRSTGRRTERRGDAGDDGARDVVRGERFELLAAAPEYERIAALEPSDALSGERVAQQQLMDPLLLAGLARCLADENPLGVAADTLEDLRTHQG